MQEKLAYPDKSEAEAAIRNLVKGQKALADDIAGAEEACHESEKTLAALEATIAEAQDSWRSTMMSTLRQRRSGADHWRMRCRRFQAGGRRSMREWRRTRRLWRRSRSDRHSWKRSRPGGGGSRHWRIRQVARLLARKRSCWETYVQMAYFDRIIARANVRFLVMSGGQYELRRRREAENNRSQSGLELDVVDHYNGSQRSVKTLSGGESFKASLSLALGLSDEIQASAGGIRLDTMFVDEGFGSLDEESLQQAMESLAGLADGNRLVGIISHVPELKQRIEKQILVRKDRSGGSFVEVRGE